MDVTFLELWFNARLAGTPQKGCMGGVGVLGVILGDSLLLLQVARLSLRPSPWAPWRSLGSAIGRHHPIRMKAIRVDF